MSKSRPKSHSKSRKRSPAKGKIAAKVPIEDWNSAAKTVKELKRLSHFCWEFFLLLFLLLWKRGRRLFSCRPSEEKESSCSLEGPDVASSSSSSALATPSRVSVAAKPASEEQTEVPAKETLSLGPVNDKYPCDAPNSTGNSHQALPVGPEDIEAVISSTRREVGGFRDRLGYQRKYEPQVSLFKRVHEIEADETKSERPGSDSGYRKQKHDDRIKKYEVFDKTVVLRQIFSDFEKTKEFEDMNNQIRDEVLKLLKRETVKNKNFEIVVRKTLYTKILRVIHFQKGNMTLKSSFWSLDSRKKHRFPTFSNDGPEYKWWEQNYVPKILEERLEILREAAKKWNSERDIFMVIELVSELNSTLHPQTSEKETVEMFRLATTICSLRSGGDSKI